MTFCAVVLAFVFVIGIFSQAEEWDAPDDRPFDCGKGYAPGQRPTPEHNP